jgi:hypothetical protein
MNKDHISQIIEDWWLKWSIQAGLPEDIKADLIQQLNTIIEHLNERAEEVADQGCEFCDALIDDYGEEHDGRREPHANWWVCGRCWNTSAGETSTTIGHLSDLLDQSLERISKLKQELSQANALLKIHKGTAERLAKHIEGRESI